MPDKSDSVNETSVQASKLQATIHSQIERLKSSVPARFVEKADQVLLGLSHTGQSIPMLLKQTFNKIDGNPNDVIGRLSRTVLEQAQSVRQTLVTKSAQLSEIADGVTTRVKSANPFSAAEAIVDEPKAIPKALKTKARSKPKVTAKPKPKAKRAKASKKASKE